MLSLNHKESMRITGHFVCRDGTASSAVFGCELYGTSISLGGSVQQSGGE